MSVHTSREFVGKKAVVGCPSRDLKRNGGAQEVRGGERADIALAVGEKHALGRDLSQRKQAASRTSLESKGGFVCKRLCGRPVEALKQEGCHRVPILLCGEKPRSVRDEDQ